MIVVVVVVLVVEELNYFHLNHCVVYVLTDVPYDPLPLNFAVLNANLNRFLYISIRGCR